MSCVICKQETNGDISVRDGELPDGTWYLKFVRSRDCDWICCDSCNDTVHIGCCRYPKSGYGDACVEKYKLYDYLREFGYETQT